MFGLDQQKFTHEAAAGGVVVLEAEGEVGERELIRLGDELFRLMNTGRTQVVIDFTEVSHLDYRGVRPLRARAELFRQAGGDIKLAGLSPYLLAIFRVAGAHAAFEYFKTPTEAMAAFHRALLS